MISYRFKRRAFLASIGGAFGLEAMLGNLEAGAAGVPSPPRLLVVYWPVGTIRYHFVPTGSGTTYTTSRILQPFETAGLREDLVVLYGLNHAGLTSLGGADEFGTVATMTGVSSPGTRQNGGEADDACAGGPSWDQIFLENVPGLARRDQSGAISGRGYYNLIGDQRVDSNELGSACLSYGYSRVAIQSARPGGTITENRPLQPTLSPLVAYNDLFVGFVPGGNSSEMLRNLRMRKSVLDSALRDLDRLYSLAPASQRPKIDVHTDAIRQLERQLADQIDQGGTTCTAPTAPSASIIGKTGQANSSHYVNPQSNVRDDLMLEEVGKTYLAVVKAAFQCDLIRIATFQWCPGTNHVAFGGMIPNNSNYYFHHPLSHASGDPAFFSGAPPTTNLYVYEFLTNVHTWYNQKLADVLAEWKSSVDGMGANLLDGTIVPVVTNVAHGGHSRNAMPALILGGRALGMQGGQFQNFESAPRPHNDLWLSVAQGFLGSNPLSVLGSETFAQNTASFTGPIAGLWSSP